LWTGSIRLTTETSSQHLWTR